MWKHALCPCLLCRGHWFLRCLCPFAPHTNEAGATPAVLTCGMSQCGTTAGAKKTTTFPNKMCSLSHALCLPATSPCWVPSSCTFLGAASDISVTLHIKAMLGQQVGTLRPLELQGLPHFSSYFNLLQLAFFYFFFFSNLSCCVGVYTSHVYKLYSSQCYKHIVCTYMYCIYYDQSLQDCVHLKTMMLSKVTYLFLKMSVSCSN